MSHAAHSGGASDPPVDFHILNRDGSWRMYRLMAGQSLLIMPDEAHMAIDPDSTRSTSIVVERMHPGNSQVLPVAGNEPQPYGAACPVI